MDNKELDKAKKWIDDWKNNRPQKAPINEFAEPRAAGIHQHSKIKYPSIFNLLKIFQSFKNHERK